MRAAQVGYGRMGQAIENKLLAQGHTVSFRIRSTNADDVYAISKDNTDVIIEFTHPNSAPGILATLIPLGIPLVVGTTGWHQHLGQIRELCQQYSTPLIYASNFSIGVNMLFRLNEWLAGAMNTHPQYDVLVEERHHRHKADSPSGTALTLANGIVQVLDRKTTLADAAQLQHRAPEPYELSVGSTRAGDIKGTHTVVYTSETDQITLQHQAFSRDGFAEGAVFAAQWLLQNKGFQEFKDIFLK